MAQTRPPIRGPGTTSGEREASTGSEDHGRPGALIDPPIDLHVLDAFWLRDHGEAATLPGVCERLLAFLAVFGPAHRNVVCGRLWPHADESAAKASLRTAVWVVRRRLPRCLSIEGSTLALSPQVNVDLNRFREAAWALIATGQPADQLDLDGILSPYSSSELLPGWYDDWLYDPREQLRQLRMHALEALCARLLEQHRHAAALHAALEVARMEPLRESAAAAVLRIHLREHNLVEARRWCDAYVQRLWDELGVTPSAEFLGFMPKTTGSRNSA